MQEKLSQSEDMKVKMLMEKEDQKKREAVLRDTVYELEQQHSELKVIFWDGAKQDGAYRKITDIQSTYTIRYCYDYTAQYFKKEWEYNTKVTDFYSLSHWCRQRLKQLKLDERQIMQRF